MSHPSVAVLVVGAGPAVWEVRRGDEVLYWNPSFARAVEHGRLLAGILAPARLVVLGLGGEEVTAEPYDAEPRPRRRPLAEGRPRSRRTRGPRLVRPAAGRASRPPTAPG